jgi:predicted TIM-barrel fold metal-dependent hydrolase
MPDSLLLRDFKPRPALVTEDHTPARARFPVIDVHNHLGSVKSGPPELLALMDELNIHCIVNLDGGWGDRLANALERYRHPYPERFCVFAWLDWTKVDQPDFGEKAAKQLAASVAAGAQGLKVFKKLGLAYRDRAGALIMPDDPRLDPIWAMAGELEIPVLIHTADPVAFFWPLDEYNERWEELHAHPDWHFYGDDYPPGALIMPAFIELIESQLRLVERHPNTTFISAHVLSFAENLRYVAQALDKYPNLYVDIGARIGELGRQPYTSRWFLTEYADRVLFGTDIVPNKETYQIYFRCLETADEYFDYGGNQGRYRIYGLDLPDEVLRKVYYENACRLIPTRLGVRETPVDAQRRRLQTGLEHITTLI